MVNAGKGGEHIVKRMIWRESLVDAQPLVLIRWRVGISGGICTRRLRLP